MARVSQDLQVIQPVFPSHMLLWKHSQPGSLSSSSTSPHTSSHKGRTPMSISFLCYWEVFSFCLAFQKVSMVPNFFKSHQSAFNEGSSRSQRGSGCVHCPWLRQCCTGFPTIWKPGSQKRVTLEPGFKSADAVRR